MTLGPMFILLAFAERWKGRVADWLTTFGRVPMFYYLLHIPVIHLAACIVSLIREGQVNPALRQPSDGAARAARRVQVEPRLALPGFCDLRCGAVFPVPVVRRSARDSPIALATLHVAKH